MNNKIISILTIGFALFFLGFVFKITNNFSKANVSILDSKNVIEAGDLISTKLLVDEKDFPIDGPWINENFQDQSWSVVKIPTFQVVQIKEFKEKNFIYYRIRIPRKSFEKISHLKNETSIFLQSLFLTRFDVVINGNFYRTFNPEKSGQHKLVLPVDDSRNNLIAIKGYIGAGDTGFDSRNKVMLGKGLELNEVHVAEFKGQTVYQLVFILCKGSILFIFALIFLQLKVHRSFDKFFIFGLCAVIEELIAGDYLYGPLNFNQMVYAYNCVNIGGAISLFLFFGQLTNLTFNKRLITISGISLTVITTLFAADALYWNSFFDLSKYMKFWNLFTVSILIFFFPKILKFNKVLALGLLCTITLYIWGALFFYNIGLNLKAYGNLLLFFMVAYQTFAIFRRGQDDLLIKERLLLEQEKDVAIGKTASFLAHDVRKPLEQIGLVFDKIMNGEADKKFLEIAKKDIDFSIENVSHQINEIMNFGKSSQISLKDVSFYRVLAHSLKQVMSAHQEMNIEIVYDLKATNTVIADESKIAVVLVNLIGNAVEAIRDIGGRYEGKIALSTQNTEDKFEFVIFNDGPNIPSSILNEIFKPLFTFGKSGGTGLGLASVLKAMNEMHGSIVVENTSSGVQFRLTFQNSTKYDSIEISKFLPTSKSFNYNLPFEIEDKSHDLYFRIFILEDDYQRINLIKSSLARLPYKLIITLADGLSSAIELINKSRYDLYLLNADLDGDKLLSGSLSFLKKEIYLYSNTTVPELEKDFVDKIFSERQRILLVDDTKLFRVSWQIYHGNHNILCASSPEEALQILSRFDSRFDLFVLDYHFSNSSMNGDELGRRILQKIPTAKILISSSVDHKESSFTSISKRDFEVRKFIS